MKITVEQAPCNYKVVWWWLDNKINGIAWWETNYEN